MRDDLSLLLNSLNDAQRQAVAAPVGRQLVLAGEGIDKDKFLSTYNSFAVKGKVEDAKKKAQAYQISGVPTMVDRKSVV